MLAILKFFIVALVFILAVSAVLGWVAFLFDIFRFKSEKQMSLPRRKLIEKLLDDQELKAPATDDSLIEKECPTNENDI